MFCFFFVDACEAVIVHPATITSCLVQEVPLFFIGIELIDKTHMENDTVVFESSYEIFHGNTS